MGRPRKPLFYLVRDGSFLARRHAERLATDELPPDSWPRLHDLQQRYRAAADPIERRWLAVQFEKALHGPSYNELLHEILMTAEVPDGELCDLTGVAIRGKGATVTVEFDDRRRGVWKLRINEDTAIDLRSHGSRRARPKKRVAKKSQSAASKSKA